MNSFYIYASIDDSLKYYLDNNSGAFTVRIPNELNLTGPWTCAFVDVYLPTPSSGDLIVCCDVVDWSLANDRKAPILRRLLKD